MDKQGRKSNKIKKNSGRPTLYTQILGKRICNLISEGKSVRKICRRKNMPTAKTIFNWLLDEDKKVFLQQYETARNIQAELMFEELLEIADERSKNVLRARLRVDTRKWYLSKVLPKKFGEKVDVTSGGKPIPILGGIIQNEDKGTDKEVQ